MGQFQGVPGPSQDDFNTLNSQVAQKVSGVRIDSNNVIALTSLFTSSALSSTTVFICFCCAGTLATDMPSNANKYGNGFIVVSPYYQSVYYMGDDGKLLIGKKTYNETSWLWRYVQLTAMS